MEEKELIALFRNTKIEKQIDIDGSLQVGIRKVLQESGILNDKISFAQSSDPRVLSVNWIASFLGETVMDVVVRMGNNFLIDLVAIPTESGGFILSLERKDGG